MPFVGTDPRGYFVVLDDASWRHSEPHHSEFRPNMLTCFRVLTKPAFILDNPSSGRIVRSAHERYALQTDVPNEFLIVPVRILSSPETLAGYGTLPEDTRSAVTIHTSDGLPRGKIIWRVT